MISIKARYDNNLPAQIEQSSGGNSVKVNRLERNMKKAVEQNGRTYFLINNQDYYIIPTVNNANNNSASQKLKSFHG